MRTIDRLRTDWLLATEIAKLEARLWSMVRRDKIRTVLLTSAVRGEGKSTTAAYLATSLGMYPNRKILVLDFDFRIPNIGRHFGLKPRVGLDQVLAGDASIRDAIMKTELPSLDVAIPSYGGADPGLLMQSRKIENFLASVRDDYDLILLDTPAMLPVADTTMLIPLVDGVLLVAMAGRTTEPQLNRAQEICAGLDANMLGLVVGNMQQAAPEYISDDYDYDYSEGSQKQAPRAKPMPRMRS
jgi:capsular exopolysaccharide synthesis family protein